MNKSQLLQELQATYLKVSEPTLISKDPFWANVYRVSVVKQKGEDTNTLEVVFLVEHDWEENENAYLAVKPKEEDIFAKQVNAEIENQEWEDLLFLKAEIESVSEEKKYATVSAFVLIDWKVAKKNYFVLKKKGVFTFTEMV
jgi:hypothetical protein